MTPEPLVWPKNPIYYEVGDRVEIRRIFANKNTHAGVRGTVTEDAPQSLVTGVTVLLDDGVKRVFTCMQTKKLGLLERLGEV